MNSNNSIENSLYEKIVEKMPIATIDVLLFSPDLGKILLFNRKNEPAKGEYYSLGGRLNKGEGLLCCAKRKLKGEAGLDIKGSDLTFIDVQNEIFLNCSFNKNISAHFLNVYYALICDTKIEINLDNQHSDYKWFSVDDPSFNQYIKIKIHKSLGVLNRK